MKNASSNNNLSSLENTVQDFFECVQKQDILTSELSSINAEMFLIEELLRAERMFARRKI